MAVNFYLHKLTWAFLRNGYKDYGFAEVFSLIHLKRFFLFLQAFEKKCLNTFCVIIGLYQFFKLYTDFDEFFWNDSPVYDMIW